MERAARERAADSVVPSPRSPGPVAPSRPHAAAVVGSDEEILAAAVPFLEQGLAAGDVTVLACPPATTALIRAGLGLRAGEIQDHPRISLLDTRAPDALAATRRVLDTATSSGSGWVRLVGQVQFGDRPCTWREGERYEAAANILLDGQPLAAMCLYDSRTLPGEVLTSARATHPHVVVDGQPAANPDFADPVDFLRRLPVPRESVEGAAPVLTVDGARNLPRLRHRLAAVIYELVPDRDQADDLHLAVSEVAANAFRHGRPPVSARVWVGVDHLICEISDRGAGFADPVAGFQPAHGPDLGRGGMGLWLARKLFDHVDLLPGDAGLTVRLSTRLL